MTHHGTIKSYDNDKGAGTITTDKGGDVLTFEKSDLQQQAQDPQVDQRFAYETAQVDGGTKRAINLRLENDSQSKHEQQARSQQG